MSKFRKPINLGGCEVVSKQDDDSADELWAELKITFFSDVGAYGSEPHPLDRIIAMIEGTEGVKRVEVVEP